DLVERRLGDMQIATLDHRPHVPEEEGQEQGTNVRPINIGVRHDDDAVIADLFDVKIIPTNASPEGRDQYLDFLAAEHLVEARLLDVQNLPPQRENRLKIAVTPLLRRASCRIALNEIDLRLRRVTLRAVGELPR